VNKNMIPNNDDLLIIKELDYICSECKKIISGFEVEFQMMPTSLNVTGLESKSEIPKCPHCGTLHFFGLKEVKGGGL